MTTMINTMPRKKLRNAVIITWVAAFLFASVAAAAFANVLLGDVSLTAKSGPEGTFDTPECIISSGPGTVDSCTLSGDTITASFSGIDDTTSMRVNVYYTPTNGDQVYTFVPDPNAPAELTQFECGVADGTVISTQQLLNVKIQAADISPDQNLASISFEHQLTFP